MNLMDMLSVDPPSSIYGNGGIDEPSIYEGEAAAAATVVALDENGLSQQSHQQQSHQNPYLVSPGVANWQKNETNASGVYYVPTSLTETQLVLIQILLHLISETLINEVRLRRKKTSIDSLLEVSSMSSSIAGGDGGDNYSEIDSNKANSLKLVSMCFDNLLRVSNHPSLLVNHFMPKRLLLSQNTTSQASMSGKLQFFNKMIDSILEQNRLQKNDEFYPILVVAKTTKELELIEGLVIGKVLTYTNSSNLKLYDDKRRLNEEEDKDSKRGIYLNLISTPQLYNNYMNKSTSSSYRFIFSFDSKIDSTNPSIEMLRSSNPCPIFVPIPIYSLEHLTLQIPEPNSGGFDVGADMVDGSNGDENGSGSLASNPTLLWKLKLLNTLVVNFNKFKHLVQNEWHRSFYYDNYGDKMKVFLVNLPHPKRIDDLFIKFNDEWVLHFSDDRLLKKLNSIYEKQIFGSMELGQPLTTDNFAYQFAELLTFKLRQMNLDLEKMHAGNEKEQGIGQKRLLETSKQVHFDEDENTIAESYHKLRKLNDEASIVDRKLSRVESDLHKVSEKDADLDNRLQQLKSITEHSISDSLLSTQTDQIANLQKELTDLQQEYDRLTNETEDLRNKYQQSSSEAVAESQKRTTLQTQLAKITNKMQLPGIAQLPDLIHQDTILTNQHKLTRLQAQHKFLKSFFQQRIEKILVERQSIMEASGASAGSSSRPSNRISRDSTPF
ncbi:HDA2 [Candida margitis]|uniref:HDA2 n=1 Tax=Candida margitis TaxID=1775924 RepID=UPI0022263290|nr:HDA2 [Candida margitis]KAI5969777.1 HDA2 [Candida margitis]